MQPTEISERVQERAGLDSAQEAHDTVLAVLEALAYRDLGDEREAFAAQLPKEYAEVIIGKAPEIKERFDASELVRRVGKRLGTPQDESRTRTHAAFSVLMEAVSGGEVDKLFGVLPDDYKPYARWNNA